MTNTKATDAETMDKATRKGSPPIKVYCLPEERRQIEAKCQAAGLSLSTYLLKVGLGYQVRGVIDYRCVRQLARINGDLGRLGDVLKMWLADPDRTARLDETAVRALLSRIEATQDEIGKVMLRVVMPAGHGR
jgi:hypothetical protein